MAGGLEGLQLLGEGAGGLGDWGPGKAGALGRLGARVPWCLRARAAGWELGAL